MSRYRKLHKQLAEATGLSPALSDNDLLADVHRTAVMRFRADREVELLKLERDRLRVELTAIEITKGGK